jgi:chromate transporter
MLPAFVIMFVLTTAYNAYGVVPGMRRVFYGLNPVVVGMLGAAAYRLGKTAITDGKQVVIAVLGALAVGLSPLGIVPSLCLAGALGVGVYHSRGRGVAAALLLCSLYAASHWGGRWVPWAGPSRGPAGGAAGPTMPGLWELGVFFGKVGAFTFGGGLTILAFLQEQVVNQLAWLTRQEFLDGLALGQLTPGPLLMLAAFVGYRTSGALGAVVGAVAIFLPSFVLVLSLVPALDRVKHIAWITAALKGISPAVIGMIAAALVQMLPKAVPDLATAVMALATIVAMLAWRVGPLPLMAGGGALGAALAVR